VVLVTVSNRTKRKLDSELEEIDKMAARLGMNRSEFIREAIRAYIRHLWRDDVVVRRYVRIRRVSLV